jgi:hypothetical protein
MSSPEAVEVLSRLRSIQSEARRKWQIIQEAEAPGFQRHSREERAQIYIAYKREVERAKSRLEMLQQELVSVRVALMTLPPEDAEPVASEVEGDMDLIVRARDQATLLLARYAAWYDSLSHRDKHKVDKRMQKKSS